MYRTFESFENSILSGKKAKCFFKKCEDKTRLNFREITKIDNILRARFRKTVNLIGSNICNSF